jgi:hypothetical protein
MDITEEMIEAATHAIHDMDCAWANCSEDVTTEGRYGRYAKAAIEAAAPLIAAQVLQAEERIEWGLRWDVSDHVTHGRSGAGDELYDEQSARAAAEQYEHATAVYRRAAGPWTDAP